MMRNITKSIVALTLTSSMLIAQTGKKVVPLKAEIKSEGMDMSSIKNRGCYTPVPDQQWENALQALIAQRKLDEANNKVQSTFSIPIVIHIIHGGQALNTYPNISNAQAVSQINILNNDYAGIGVSTSGYPAAAFAAYATAAGVPAANKDATGRVKISNFNISFCLATINKTGGAMSEIGIDRVNFNTFTLSAGYTSKDPANAAYNTPTTFMNFVDAIVKPQTIWDPTKYMNIWTTDANAAAGLLGYATFPVGTALTGITGNGTATTDGLWCNASAFGNTGSVSPPYNLGRTASHEIGHWLGLRHIGGDVSGGCGTDYCNDTPKNKGGTTAAGTGNDFGQNYGVFTYPYHANTCTGGVDANINGDMYMNFMDYSDDIQTYMFTEDQRTRAQTVMANGTYRKFLGTHGLCATGSPTAAVALFTMTNTACNGAAVSVTNNSTGSPTPSYTWSAAPATGVVFSPNANATSPTITFTTNGTYVITLAAKSSTLATSTKTNNIVISTCTVAPVCSKTITNVSATDTMYVGAAGTDTVVSGCSPKAGYVFGSNCYDDLEKAEFFAAGTYSNVSPSPVLVTGGIVVYYKNGTKGTTGAAATPVSLKMYGGTLAGGPTTLLGTKASSLGAITAATATNNIGYLGGNPLVTYSTNIAIPYKFTFATPIAAPVGGFYLATSTPTNAGDTAVVFSDFHATTNTSWEKQSDNTWHDMNVAWGGLVNNMAIFPLVICTTATDLMNYNSLANNVNIIPNPSSGLFNVLINLSSAQDITIQVSDVLGQSLLMNDHKSLMTAVLPVDLSEMTSGVYFITVTNGKEKNVQRVILTK